VKRRREHDPKFQTELNIALVHHAGEGNEKGVQLCLWAGADPHAPAPSFRYPDDADEEDGENDPNERFRGFTAIHEASRGGHTDILERLGPDPLRDGGFDPGTAVQFPDRGKFVNTSMALHADRLSGVAPAVTRSASVTRPVCTFLTSVVFAGSICHRLAS
jgi:hypothetical protein